MIITKELEEKLKERGCKNIKKVIEILTKTMGSMLIDRDIVEANFHKGKQRQLAIEESLENIEFVSVGKNLFQVEKLSVKDLNILADMFQYMGLKSVVYLKYKE